MNHVSLSVVALTTSSVIATTGNAQLVVRRAGWGLDVSTVSVIGMAIERKDPVALTSFSSIIRPLSIMFYAAKGDMVIKVMVL